MMKEGWERSSKNKHIDHQTIRKLISQVFGEKYLEIQSMETGLSSGTYKVQVEGMAAPFVLRISAKNSVAQKEKTIAEKLSGSVPIADYIYLDTSGDLIQNDSRDNFTEK